MSATGEVAVSRPSVADLQLPTRRYSTFHPACTPVLPRRRSRSISIPVGALETGIESLCKGPTRTLLELTPLTDFFEAATGHPIDSKDQETADLSGQLSKEETPPASSLKIDSTDKLPLGTESSQKIKLEDESTSLIQLILVDQHVENAGSQDASGHSNIANPLIYTQSTKAETKVSSTVLADILPFNTSSRLAENAKCCVASTLDHAQERCGALLATKFPVASFTNRITGGHSRSSMAEQLHRFEEVLPELLCHEHLHIALQNVEKIIDAAKAGSKVGADADGLELSVALAAVPFWVQALSQRPRPGGGNQSEVQQIFQAQLYESESNRWSEILAVSVVTTSTGVSSLNKSLASLTTEPLGNTRNKAAASLIPQTNFHLGLQRFVDYHPWRELGVPQLLRKVLQQPLGQLDQKQGFIYIYWNPGNFGFVKIGWTSRTIDQRLNEWKKGKCEHGVDEHKISDDTGTILDARRVPHVHRVERLIFAELRDYRLEEQGCACNKKHQEWFHVSSVHAAKVRRRWEDFMLSEPRYTVGVGGRLICQDVERDEMKDFLTPLEIVKTAPPKVGTRSRRESTQPRPSLRRSERLR